MFAAQLPLILPLVSVLVAGSCIGGWLPNGPDEYNTRCSLQSEATGEYVCFTTPTEITLVATDGNFQGYASLDGLGKPPPSSNAFALVCLIR